MNFSTITHNIHKLLPTHSNGPILNLNRNVLSSEHSIFNHITDHLELYIFVRERFMIMGVHPQSIDWDWMWYISQS